jgi:hypothetical protein
MKLKQVPKKRLCMPLLRYDTNFNYQEQNFVKKGSALANFKKLINWIDDDLNTTKSVEKNFFP